MQSDRELLELAAKAAGVWQDGYRPEHRQGEGWLCLRPADEKCPFVSIWAPLTDDGDALRLANKLRIHIEHMKTLSGKDFGINCWPSGHGEAGVSEEDLADYDAATRRAIVRAAAAIGGDSNG